MTVKRRRQSVEPVEPDRYYTGKQLSERWNVHPVTVWKWAAKGLIPPAIKLGPNCSRWEGRAILKFEAARAER